MLQVTDSSFVEPDPAANNSVGVVQFFWLNARWAPRSLFLRSCQAALFSASRRDFELELEETVIRLA